MKSKVQPSQILKTKTVSEHLLEWVQLQDERIYIIMKKTVKNRHNIVHVRIARSRSDVEVFFLMMALPHLASCK